MSRLEQVTRFLDRRLAVAQFSDSSNNGLQVANSGRVRRVCCGVDASLECFEAAVSRQADLLIVHHGLSWGDSLKRLTGLNYRLVSFLMEHDLALWACHLPLDAHPTLGNNACIARVLGLTRCQPFGDYHGQTIGIRGVLPGPLPYARFRARVAARIASDLREMPFGGPLVRAVGVISGGGAAEVAQAAEAGLDAYVSGEATLQGYNLARQHGIHALFAGHYATERFGVTAVGELVQRQFGIPAEFVNLNVPY